MKRLIRLFGVSSMIFLWSGNVTAAGHIRFCEIAAAGEFATGEVFDGTASDTDPGGESIDWTHDTADLHFETMAVDPDGIVCTLNGAKIARFVGTGTVGGVSGYSYEIDIEDSRPAPSGSVVLVAAISHRPTNRTEGTADFASPQVVVIPDELDVTAGGSGNGWTRLHLDDITCRYRGTGMTYGFERCTDPLDSGYVAGDTLAVTHARLRIQQSDRDLGTTVVEAQIVDGVPAPGEPDSYSILITGGGTTYSFSGDVIDGDIDIEMLPGGPPTP